MCADAAARSRVLIRAAELKRPPLYSSSSHSWPSRVRARTVYVCTYALIELHRPCAAQPASARLAVSAGASSAGASGATIDLLCLVTAACVAFIANNLNHLRHAIINVFAVTFSA
jgi:hypothetical protein